MTNIFFTSKGSRAKEFLELLHIDVRGPFNVQACGGYEYCITFIDDYSKYHYVYLIHRKFNTLDKFKEFKMKLENQSSKHLKALQSNRGREYMSNEFDFFLKDDGIMS